MPTFPLPGANWGNLHSLRLVATTGLAGYTLVNGTGPIVTWTAPNDGQLHRVFIILAQHVTVLEVGGSVEIDLVYPDGTTDTHTPYAGGEAAGLDTETYMELVQPGSAVTVRQLTALTGGTARLWAELWAL